MARLIQTDGEQIGVEYALKESTSMGRGSDNDIVLEEKKASRHQAVVMLRQEYLAETAAAPAHDFSRYRWKRDALKAVERWALGVSGYFASVAAMEADTTD